MDDSKTYSQGNPEETTKTDTSLNSKKGNPSKILLIIIAILLVLVACLAGVVIFLLATRSKTDVEEGSETATSISTISTATTVSPGPAPLEDKIIYTIEGNIYIADKTGKNSKKLTDNVEGEYMMSVQLITDNLLGYFSCTYKTKLFHCEINTLNIDNSETTNLKEFDEVGRVEQVSFISSSEYAYSKMESDFRYAIYYVKDAQEQKLKEWDEETYGRGIMLYDNSRLRFSPDGDKLLHISTISRSGMDFSVYIFDLEGKLLDSIDNATFPTWKSNSEILYMSYDMLINDDSKRGLFVRDVEAKKSSKVDGAFPSMYIEGTSVSYPFTGGYDLIYSGDKTYYWGIFVDGLNSGHSYIYDFQTNLNELLDDNLVYPVPLSGDDVIFARTEPCDDGSECAIPHSFPDLTGLKVSRYILKNVKNGKEAMIKLPEEALSGGVITESSHYID
ncbi:MAG: hypothetical protein PHS44_07345 [Candidatus Dojkabacteria bacterium]|nr:hypothetical protein [Candidatus Dojkabacteria bacterium]